MLARRARRRLAPPTRSSPARRGGCAAPARLPVPTHDDAAVLARPDGLPARRRPGDLERRRRPDRPGEPARPGARARSASRSPTSAPPSIGSTAYLAGGYTGAQYATGILALPRRRAKLAARLPAGLRYAGVAALGERIYVAGGITTAGPTRAVYAFDPAAGTVTRIATLPAPADHVALAALGSRLLLVGGGSRTVLAIDPARRTVRTAGTLPQALTDPAAVSLGGSVYVLGGGTADVLRLRSVLGEQRAQQLVEGLAVAARDDGRRQRAHRRRARDVHRQRDLAEVVARLQHAPRAETSG